MTINDAVVMLVLLGFITLGVTIIVTRESEINKTLNGLKKLLDRDNEKDRYR